MSYLGDLLGSHGATILFVVVFAEMMGLPVAAAPVLLAAGALAAEGAISPAMAIVITIAACVLGDLIWFYLGRTRGEHVRRLFFKLFHRNRPGREGVEELFGRYSLSAVAVAKFIPGVGFLIPGLAGTCRIPFSRFICVDILGSLLYAFFYLEAGLIFSTQITGALSFLSRFTIWATALALLGGAFYVVRKLRTATVFPQA